MESDKGLHAVCHLSSSMLINTNFSVQFFLILGQVWLVSGNDHKDISGNFKYDNLLSFPLISMKFSSKQMVHQDFAFHGYSFSMILCPLRIYFDLA